MKKSPVIINRRGNLIEIESRETGQVLGYCYIGDDVGLEIIADLLSAKRMPQEAMRLRQMAMDARKQ